MSFTKITLCMTVDSDEADIAIQYLDDALDKKGDRFTTFSEEITQDETAEPPNAAEIRGQ